MPANSIPKYRRDSKGQAFVQHRSIPNKTRRYYLGKFNSPESHQRYQKFLARLTAAAANHVGFGPVFNQQPEIDEVIVLYLEWAKLNYRRPDGIGSEYDCMKYALRPLSELFGDQLVNSFGPRSLAAIREHLAATNHTRTGVNRTIGRIKRFWRWACEREYAPPELYHKLLCVSSLYPGQANVREAEPRGPVAIAAVSALLPFVSSTVAAMLRVQYLCGMRPGEVCIMRPCDIKSDGTTWFYYPQRHKTAWRGFSLVKAIPPVAQPIVWRFCRPDPTEYIFKPVLRIAANLPSKRYTTTTYRGAVDHGFVKAEKQGIVIPRFTPNQLRHSILRDVSRWTGQQDAQRWAGHEDLATTNIYTGLNEMELAGIAGRLNQFLVGCPLAS